MVHLDKLIIGIIFLFIIVTCIPFITQKPELTTEVSSSNISCPMFKCNIYRTGNLNFNPEKNNIDMSFGAVGSNAPEGMEREILSKKDEFDPSPIFVDLDMDGIDEVITFYKNTIYNITTKSRSFHNFVMAIKYKENPTMLEKLEFGESPYIRFWYFVLPSEVHTSFAVGDLNNDGYPEIAFGCDDGNLYVLDNKGKLLFKFKTEGKVRSTPAIFDIDNDGKQEIIFGSDDNNLYCLENEGKLKWKFNAKVFRNYFVIGSEDGNLYFFNEKEIWNLSLDSPIFSTPSSLKDKVLISTSNGKIYLTNLTSKKKIWESNLTKEFSCSPSLGNKYLFSCFFVQYENNNQFAGIFISSVNENYGKDKK